MIDMASVYAERYRKNPDVLRAAVIGQSPDSRLDPYTALNALKLVNETNRMMMAGQAQQPTSAPSLVAQNMAPQAGLGAMVPGAMGQMGQAPQGMPPQGMPPQGPAPAPQGMPPQGQAPVMQAASGGLAGLPTPEYEYAKGGIVAFQSGGLNAIAATDDPYSRINDAVAVTDDPYSRISKKDFDNINKADETDDTDDTDETDGTEIGFAAAQRLANKRIASLGNVQRKPFDRAGFIKNYMDEIKKEGGANIYDEELARGPQDEADRARARRVGEANALFTAAGKILKGSSLAEGASEALPAFGGAMNEVEKLDQAAKQANARMQFALKDAKRKERMGDLRGAAAAAELARKYEQDENVFEFNKARYGAEVAVKNVQANRPLRGAGAGAGGEGKLPQVDRDAAAIAKQIVDIESTNPNDPKLPALKQKLAALERIIATTKTSESGPGKLGAQNTQIFVGAAKDASAEARKLLYTDPVMRSNDPAAISKRYNELYARAIQSKFPGAPLSELLAQMPAEDLGSVAAPTAGNPAAQKALPMPATKAELKTNQLYNTRQGLAIWNGTKFVAQ
jgi:hypothetical protein